MSYSREFATVELLLNSKTAETRGVDAFALCLIKMEKQLRRLFTYSVFQFPCFTSQTVPQLKDALAHEKNIYFEGFIKGFEAIHPKSVADLVGGEYVRLHRLHSIVTKYRNKIFHGQLTGQELSRSKLIDHAYAMQEWCRLLGDGARAYINYDGFGDSFRKASNPNFTSGYKLGLASVPEYKALLRTLRRQPA